MNKKILVICLILSIFLITNNLGAEVILDYMITKNTRWETNCERPTPNYTFYPRDRRAYCWIEIDDITEGDIIRYEWYDPTSTLYLDYIHIMGFTGNGCARDWIDIRNDIPASMPGDWHVDVYYNGIFQFTENFTIEEGLCAITQIYGDHSKKTQLLRNVRDNLLKTTPEGREIIKLYYQWSPVIARAMEQDNEFKENVKEMIDQVLVLTTEE